MASRPRPEVARSGLDSLRRAGAVADLLFLYECETQRVTGLRTIADRLGLTVQAASHSYRSLARRGLVALDAGHYRPTDKGVAWLHAALDGMREDLAGRLDRLRIVRLTTAIAAARIARGAPVTLQLRNGLLYARPGGSEGTRGTARTAAEAGRLVEVGNLEGIVPLPYGALRLATFDAARYAEPGTAAALRAELRRHPPGLLLTFGLEAHHLVERIGRPAGPVGRFGVAAAALEATRLGVDCTLVVGDRDVPGLGRQLEGPDLPALTFVPLDRPPRRRGARPAQQRADRGHGRRRVGDRPRPRPT